MLLQELHELTCNTDKRLIQILIAAKIYIGLAMWHGLIQVYCAY